MKRLFLQSTLALLAAACLAPLAVQAQPATVLRVSAIPDEAPTELQRKFKPLGDYLALDIPVLIGIGERDRSVPAASSCCPLT